MVSKKILFHKNTKKCVSRHVRNHVNPYLLLLKATTLMSNGNLHILYKATPTDNLHKRKK